jgi:transposase
MMDEFALHRGHRYATVVADAQTRQVLWVGVGRSRVSVRPFFRLLGQYCHQVEAMDMDMDMDMNTAYDLEVKQHCPQAEVVYDLFHVVAKFGREVIDRVRVDQANLVRRDKPQRRLIKSSRWLLLKNRNRLNPDQQIRLDELLMANRQLWVVYLVKDQLKELWRARSVGEAFLLWRELWRMALESGVEPLIRFFKNLRPYLRGILASAKYPLNTSVLEGMNNKIKVIKRKAYGYRDFDYFVLKIKAAFPGNLR